MQASITPSIFRQYDIRGIYPKELNKDTAYQIARAFAALFKSREKPKEVAVGMDCRLHSGKISSGIIGGLTDSGLNVIDIGLCTTPMLYFAVKHLKLRGGIMVTGSHNPPEYNGLKMLIGGSTIHGEDIQKIKELTAAGNFDKTAKGRHEKADIPDEYTAYMANQFGGLKNYPLVKVAVDCGNGCASLVIEEVLKRVGCHVTPLYCKTDGRFPNHHPDPTVEENLANLRQTVTATDAELGVAFDGDADRLGVVDQNGEIIWGDKLLYLFAKQLADQSGTKVIGEVKCSQTVYDSISRIGVTPIIWKTGHSLIKEKMRESGAQIAGEMSGHFFFADRYFGYDDGIYAALRLIELLKQAKTSLKDYQGLSSLLKDIPATFSTPEIRLECPDDKKFRIVGQFKDQITGYTREQWEGLNIKQINDIDGIRVTFEEGWGLVRASNTQPAIIMRFEGYTRDNLDKIKHFFETKLNTFL